MGNQQSSSPGASGHVSARPRRDSDGPAHVPPGVTCHVTSGRERRHSGQRDKTGPLDTASLASRLRKLSGGDQGDR